METVTNFGDLAVLLPIAAIATIGLTIKAGYRYAMVWLFAVGGCAAVIGALKMTLCCGWEPTLVSPSGHTAMSTVVYGGLGFLVATQRPHWQQTVVSSFAMLGVGLIAYSRIAVHAHTPAEVVAGLIVGSCSLLVLIALMRHQGMASQFEMGAGAIVAGAACAAVLMHGHHLSPPPLCVCWLSL